MRSTRVMLLGLLTVLNVGCSWVALNDRIIYVSSTLVSSTSDAALTPQAAPPPPCTTGCLVIRDEPTGLSYLMYTNAIEGFTFRPGFTYKLRVQTRTTTFIGVPASPTESWKLLDVLEKTPDSNQAHSARGGAS